MKLFFALSFAVVSQFTWAQSSPVKILFVGNSLTYENDLPGLVERITASKGIAIKHDRLAKPNYALEDHWLEGQLQKMIKKEKYDYVIVQQGPSSQAEGREMLLNYGKKIADLCSRNKAKLVFFMVWPARANYHMFDGVIANYTTAAVQNDAILCPVGKRWKEYMDKTKDFSFYGTDGFHPSPAGSQNAAEIIVEVLFGVR